MINLFISILLVLSIFGEGIFFLIFFLPRTKKVSILLVLPFSFAFGLSIQISIQYIGYFLNILEITQWLAPIIGLFLLGISIVNKEVKEKIKVEKYDIFIILSIFIIFLVQSFTIQYFPVLENDARAIWTLKAKLLYYGKDIFQQYLTNPIYIYSHQDYPLGLPLIWSSFFKILNSVYEPVVSIFSHALFWQIPLLFLGLIRRKYNIDNNIATFITILLFFPLATFVSQWAGYADFGLSFIFASTITALILFHEENNILYLYLALFFGSSALFLKNEGIPWFIFLSFVIILVKKFKKYKITDIKVSKLKQSIIFILPLFLSSAWFYTKKILSVGNDLAKNPNLNILSYLKRIEPIYKSVISRSFNGSTLGILWSTTLIAFILLVILNRRVLISKSMIPAILILLQFSSYILIYMLTPYDVDWHISTSFSRLLIHLIPSIILFTMYRLDDFSFNIGNYIKYEH